MPDPATTTGAPSSYRSVPVSFVRRSRRLSDAQQRLWDEQRRRYLVDVPRAAASTSVEASFVLDLGAVPPGTGPLVVEIGSGQGDAVVAAAAAHPGVRYVAVEVYEPGLAHTARQAAEAGVENLRLVQANAPEVLASALPEASVDELWVFFPDPWRKSRHTKRRLVDEAFLPLASRVLVDGGVLRFASDWQPYAEQVRDLLEAAPGFVRHGETRPDGWAPRFEGRVLTGFERKGTAAGRVVHDLAYARRPRR
ncbi:tRNA (guanine-N(7)-)-methyltransferase [Luteimicrobium album]|uniref:tRNA (guanine-N(7)-)-methyltransferase n=1 Tax=Luteimicrobium album TaxID=1054550 RepID=A0ABQ6IA77_9MICO|nr:tRNA (guanosine(46)-N7)-methyltransferase TrmB [Luteimicrobium album]GMA26599.1 tRNA (guanine-N(7)-)-methyltransferase [Luteimicrobium album]